MDRTAFRKLFKTLGPAVLPVIHVLDAEQASRNVRTIISGGAQGAFLINHDFSHDRLLPIIEHVRTAFPALWLGVNFLAVTGRDAFPLLGKLEKSGVPVDAYWADDARIDERSNAQVEAVEIDRARAESGWSGLYFGGTAFKKQREVAPEDYGRSAEIACRHMDVVTTSGIATGQAADLAKIETFRQACGEHAIAIASGVTPDNVHNYAREVDAILVATGINYEGDFYNADPAKLRQLMDRVRTIGAGEP
ncbi:MAG: BtpA/SgcQ family protein [Pseudomonadota bacterium]